MIDERTLTLYYYDDGLDEDERRTVREALQTDRLLAARFEALKERLDALREPEPTSAPEHLKHQWHDLVAREAQLERQKTAPAPRRFPWLGLGAAFTSVLALGIAIGVWMPRGAPPPGTTAELAGGPQPSASSSDAPAAFERGLQLYLEESRSELASLDNRSHDEQARLLLQIIAQNRLFEQAAEKQQVPEVARLMRAFEPILLRLAAEDTAPQDAEALRRQLAFELNAMLTKLQQPSSKKTTTT